MRIALVHDYLVQNGGAERVLSCFCELFPDAPIYTLIHNPEAMHGNFSNRDIRVSFIQKIPFAKKRHRAFPLVMPLAIEQFDFSDYDLVLSDSSSFAKGAITGPDTLHICYMHTPMRYAWDDCQKYTRDFYFPSFIKKIVPVFMNWIRLWDRVSAERPDRIIANSNFVKRRIEKYYRRKSLVINPPVDYARFASFAKNRQAEKSGYFLMVGRLIAYKKFDIAIRAFNRLGLPLKIIGRGPEMESLKKMAKPNVEFLGRVSDGELARYYAGARAFIFPQEEDFGIVAIEAMSAGVPLIAYRGGDIPEHMEEGKTGIFFERQKSEDIEAAVGKFRDSDFDHSYISSRMEKFDKERFKSKIKEYIETEYLEWRNSDKD
jgi:glycosyltransferase involved in cell wall biosynthesis